MEHVEPRQIEPCPRFEHPPAAFDTFFREMHSAALGVARQICPSAADDVVQVSIERLLRTAHRYQQREWRPIFITIVKHAAIDEVRRRNRFDDWPIDPNTKQPKEVAVTIDYDNLTGPWRQRVLDHLGSLPDREREILWMRLIDGDGDAEVGRRFGIDRAVVFRLVRRTRRALAGQYGNPFDELTM